MKWISRVNYKRGDLLYDFPAETRLTVYRLLDIELGQSETAHAGSFDHAKVVSERNIIENSSEEWHYYFELYSEDLDRANKIEKW